MISWKPLSCFGDKSIDRHSEDIIVKQPALLFSALPQMEKSYQVNNIILASPNLFGIDLVSYNLVVKNKQSHTLKHQLSVKRENVCFTGKLRENN